MNEQSKSPINWEDDNFPIVESIGKVCKNSVSFARSKQRVIQILAVVLILSVIMSNTLYGFNTKKEGFKEQNITVTVIDRGNNGCGNRMGGFEAVYQGKKIEISFTHGRVLTDLELCPNPGQKLSLVNRSVTLIGTWDDKTSRGEKVFNATEISIAGEKRKAWPKVPGNIEYTLSAKKFKKGHDLRVYLNKKEVPFRNTVPQCDCNRCGGPIRYDALSVYEIKQGNKIIDKEDQGIEIRLDGAFESTWNGSESAIIAKKAGRASLILLYWRPNGCIMHFYIPFIIRS